MSKPFDQKSLGEPYFEELSENGHRVRRNLILTASISIFFVLFDLKIVDGKIFGFTINNLDNNIVNWVLFVILSYHTIHFALITWEHFKSHFFRITGPWHSKKTPQGHKDEDVYHRQNIHDWLYNRQNAMVESLINLSKLINQTSTLATSTEDDHKLRAIESIKENLTTYSQGSSILILDSKKHAAMKHAGLTEVTYQEINARLDRYENAFEYFKLCRSFRWFFFEYCLPFSLAIFAFLALGEPHISDFLNWGEPYISVFLNWGVLYVI